MGFFSTSSWAGKMVSRVPEIPRCGACGLRSKSHSPQMPVTGKGSRKVLFVGEAPGEEEDRRGIQFIGKSGQVLRRILRELGVDLEECWKTNAVCCHPPSNEIKDAYIEACRPVIFGQIRELNPRVIVPLGVSAVRSLVGLEWGRDLGPMGRWLGWRIPSAMHGAWVCPTYHPSYLARMNEDPQLMQMVEGHLRTALRLEKRSPPLLPREELERQVECVFSGVEARMRFLELVRQEGILAFDYETTGLKPEHSSQQIVSCSFCLNGGRAWSCMMDDQLFPLLSKVLRNRKLAKVASNLKFEERWTRAKLGHGVVNWHWDTMLAAHVLDNRPLISSLKFQAYVLLGAPDYSSAVKPYLEVRQPNGLNRIREMDMKSLLLYGGLDSYLTYRVMEKQKRLLGDRS